MSQDKSIIITQDGSTTLYNHSIGDHYHSTHGAIQESHHIFIHSGLNYFLEIGKCAEVSILEIGLGTGLNALMTALNAPADVKIYYTALEPFPIEESILNQLNYVEQLHNVDSNQLFDKIHQLPWGSFCDLNLNFSLRKLPEKVQNFSDTLRYDLVYFDAFSPSTQPDIWTQNVMDKIFKICRSKAVLMTYSSKGEVRRNLQQAGFNVEKIPGPVGKRDITRALKF